VGFEVGYVLAGAARTDQRVYLLFDRSQRSRISRMIAGTAHPACRVLPYRDVAEALAFIDAHLGR